MSDNPRNGASSTPAPNVYSALPPILGGSTAPRPNSATLAPLLPFPPGARVPPDDALHARVRNRALFIEGDPAASSPPASSPPVRRTRGRVSIPPEQAKFALYAPLALLWVDYASKLLGPDASLAAGERVLRMDLHGAPVEVARSRDPGLVGVSGILVAETANTVLIVTRADRVLTLPKNITVLRFIVGQASVEISLPALPFRASERSARKLKKKHMAPL